MRTPRLIFVGLVVLVGLVPVACCPLADVGKPKGGPYPDACEQWSYSPRRCEAIVDLDKPSVLRVRDIVVR